MVTIQTEPMRQAESEARGFMKAYFEEVGTPFETKVNWEYYHILEDSGLLSTVTMRDEGVLVGFESFLVGAHPHAQEVVVAQELAIYVHPSYRGLKALKMMSFAEKAVKERGAKYCIVSARKGNLAELLPKRGFSPFEQSFIKEL